LLGGRDHGGVQVWVAVDEAAVHSGRPRDRRHGDDGAVGAQLSDRVVDLQPAAGGVAAS